MPRMKYWEIIADNLSKAGWSWGCVSALDSERRTIWIVDAHRGDGKRYGWSYGYVSAVDSQGRTIWIANAHRDGKRFVVRADEKLTAFVELEAAIQRDVSA